MKKINELLTILIIIASSSAMAGVHYYWDDGVSHTIDYSDPWVSVVYLDSNIANDPGTHLDVTGNGEIGTLLMYNNSTATINGVVVGTIYARDYSIVNIIGSVYESNVCAYGNSRVNISGGNVGVIYANNSSTVYMSGGTTQSSISVRQDAILYLVGINFSIKDSEGNIISLSYGDKLSDYTGCYDDGTGLHYYGTVWGDFADGGWMSSKFRIYNTGDYDGIADIIIIPEPATLALFGLGTLLLRRKK